MLPFLPANPEGSLRRYFLILWRSRPRLWLCPLRHRSGELKFDTGSFFSQLEAFVASVGNTERKRAGKLIDDKHVSKVLRLGGATAEGAMPQGSNGELAVTALP